MKDEQRAAVASYFAVYQGQEKGLAKMFLRDINHPFVTRAYMTLASVWLEVQLPPSRYYVIVSAHLALTTSSTGLSTLMQCDRV